MLRTGQSSLKTVASKRLAGEVPWRPVIRTDFYAGRRGFLILSRLAPCAGSEDQPVDRFDAPALLNEPAGQPVEQFRMRGTLAIAAKVVHGAHNAFTEMVLPDSVDHDARGERVLRARDPARQRNAARARGELAGADAFHDRRVGGGGGG